MLYWEGAAAQTKCSLQQLQQSCFVGRARQVHSITHVLLHTKEYKTTTQHTFLTKIGLEIPLRKIIYPVGGKQINSLLIHFSVHTVLPSATWLFHNDISRIRGDSTMVIFPVNQDVPNITPVGAPTVLDYPVILATQGAPSHCQDCVVQGVHATL